MNLKTILGAAMIAGTALSMQSCYKNEASDMLDSREQLLENVMQNNPQKELDSLKNAFSDEAQGAQSQHAADSIVFRNMFEGSDKAKDSTFLTDYNEMMKKTKTPIYGSWADNNMLDKKLRDVLTVKEHNEINKNPLMNERNFFGIGRQYLVDSVYHHKLFEKHGLLDEQGTRLFKDLCNKVRP